MRLMRLHVDDPEAGDQFVRPSEGRLDDRRLALAKADPDACRAEVKREPAWRDRQQKDPLSQAAEPRRCRP